MPTAASVGGWGVLAARMSFGAVVGDDGRLLLVVVEGLDEPEGAVLDVGQGAEPLARSLADLGRVGAEEGGRGRRRSCRRRA